MRTSLRGPEIKQVPGMATYQVVSMAYYLSMMTPSNTPLLKTFLDVVIAIAMIIGFIVIFQAMYAAVWERTREIGTMLAMGTPRPWIVALFMLEATVTGILGAAVGVIAGNLLGIALNASGLHLPPPPGLSRCSWC